MSNHDSSISPQQWEAWLASGRLTIATDESVLASYQGEQGVLLDYARGAYYGLNPVATTVWKLICAGRTFQEITEAITREYDVSREDARSDVAHLLHDLCSRGILQAKNNVP